MASDGLRASVEKMRREGVHPAAVETFRHYYEELASGASGLMPDSEIAPVDDVPDAAELPWDEAGSREALDRAVTVKLNGGLGTSMGMTRAKSLLEVRSGLTFLDLIARQTLELRGRSDARLPLVLMNSFYTREDTLAHLERYPDLPAEVPLDFVQNKEPKIRADDLQPVSWPTEPALEWCPPGHGDLYTALVASGMLETLLDHGYEYAFVSNADNLGATLEPRILAWFAAEGLPFVMEVADRTAADRKGGHLARTRAGQLVLRELAQAPEEDLDSFQDVDRFRYFNTNTLWVNLRMLADVLAERDNVLGLPMMVNRKTVDPGDKSSTEVFQVETAMGAAIGVFEGARAVRVDRARFAPVKTTNDLLALRSDAYVVSGDARVELAPQRAGGGSPLVDLDPDHYKLVGAFEERFPEGPPSLLACERFTVRGDVTFGRGVIARGTVELDHAGEGPTRVEDGAVLEG